MKSNITTQIIQFLGVTCLLLFSVNVYAEDSLSQDNTTVFTESVTTLIDTSNNGGKFTPISLRFLKKANRDSFQMALGGNDEWDRGFRAEWGKTTGGIKAQIGLLNMDEEQSSKGNIAYNALFDYERSGSFRSSAWVGVTGKTEHFEFHIIDDTWDVPVEKMNLYMAEPVGSYKDKDGTYDLFVGKTVDYADCIECPNDSIVSYLVFAIREEARQTGVIQIIDHLLRWEEMGVPVEYGFKELMFGLEAKTTSPEGGSITFNQIVLNQEEIMRAPSSSAEKPRFEVTPNPITGQTATLSFSLPKSGNVNISLYNNAGMKCATLFEEEMAEGSHKVEVNTDTIPSGLYHCVITSGSFVIGNNTFIK